MIPTVIPNETGCFMLIDSGANAECNSDMLVQFGMMGSVYMNKIQELLLQGQAHQYRHRGE